MSKLDNIILKCFSFLQVNVQNIPCGTTGVTCTKSVEVVLANNLVISMIQGRDPVIGNLSVNLNQEYQTYGVSIARAGLWVYVRTNIGLTVQYDEGITTVIMIMQMIR